MGTKISIELELDHSQTVETIEDVLNALTPADKVRIAEEYIRKWFEESPKLERKLYAENVAKNLLSATNYNGQPKYATLEEALASRKVASEMQNLVTTKERVLAKLFTKLSVIVEKRISVYVDQDSTYQNIANAVTNKVIEKIPNMVMMALIHAIKNQLQFNLADLFVSDTNNGIQTALKEVVQKEIQERSEDEVF